MSHLLKCLKGAQNLCVIDVYEMIELLPNMMYLTNLPYLDTFKPFYFQQTFSGGPPKLEGQESVRWARREKETRSKNSFHLRRDFNLRRNVFIHRDFNLSKDSYPCSRDIHPCRDSQLYRDFHLCKNSHIHRNSHSPSRDSP